MEPINKAANPDYEGELQQQSCTDRGKLPIVHLLVGQTRGAFALLSLIGGIPSAEVEELGL